MSPVSPALEGRFFTTEPPEKPSENSIEIPEKTKNIATI